MSYRKARGPAVASGALLAWLALAAPTRAGLLDCLFGPSQAPSGPQPVVVSRTTYMPRFPARPVYAAPACVTCAAPACSSCVAPGCSSCAAPACSSCMARIAGYMPQTSYRSVIETVPVTGFRAAVRCDPCTGGCRTCYQPVTARVRQVQLIPYTTYRMAFYNPCPSCAPAACVSCPSGACFAAGGSCFGYGGGCGTRPGPIVSGGCASCGAAPRAAISPGAVTAAPSGLPSAATVAPGGAAASPPGKTYREGTGAGSQTQKPPADQQGPDLEGKPEPKLRPQPMRQSGLKRLPGTGPWIAPFGAPPRVEPNSRTTALPIRPAAHYLPAGWTPPHSAPPAGPATDDDGWRPARD